MTQSLSRRAFLTRLAAAPVGAALAGAALPLSGWSPHPRSRTPGGVPPLGRTGAELPPPVVGLRSLEGDFVFDPPGLLLESDSRLIWLNMGDFHSATAFHPDNAELLGGEVPLRIPEEADSWHSGMLGLTDGSEFEHRFRVPGVYDYFCQPHYGFGMVGRLVVDEPRDGPGTTPIDALPEEVRNALPAISDITGPRGRGWAWASRLNGVLWMQTHDRDAAPAASAVHEGIANDEILHGRIADRGRLEEAVARFTEQVRGGTGYEDLVQRADEVKALL